MSKQRVGHGKMAVNKMKFSRLSKSKVGYFFLAFIFIFILVVPSKAFSQESIDVSSIQKDNVDTWHVLKQFNDITLSYQFVSCGAAENIFFKLSNASKSDAEVTLAFKQYKGNDEIETNPDDMNIKITVPAGSQIFRTCLDGPVKLNFFVREEGGLSNYSTLKLVSSSAKTTN